MDPVDAIGMALTPGTVFNQQNRVFRSAKALAQFANVDQGEVLSLVAENLADRVTIRPSAKRPENGPLIALTEFIPDQQENAVQVQIVGGNAVEPDGLGVEMEDPFDEGGEALLAKIEGMGGSSFGEGVLEEDEIPEKASEGENVPNETFDPIYPEAVAEEGDPVKKVHPGIAVIAAAGLQADLDEPIADVEEDDAEE